MKLNKTMVAFGFNFGSMVTLKVKFMNYMYPNYHNNSKLIHMKNYIASNMTLALSSIISYLFMHLKIVYSSYTITFKHILLYMKRALICTGHTSVTRFQILLEFIITGAPLFQLLIVDTNDALRSPQNICYPWNREHLLNIRSIEDPACLPCPWSTADNVLLSFVHRRRLWRRWLRSWYKSDGMFPSCNTRQRFRLLEYGIIL